MLVQSCRFGNVVLKTPTSHINIICINLKMPTMHVLASEKVVGGHFGDRVAGQFQKVRCLKIALCD